MKSHCGAEHCWDPSLASAELGRRGTGAAGRALQVLVTEDGACK